MPDERQVLELGIMLGQRRAFGMVAGRCSAAQAEYLGKVRDEKTYLKFAINWAGFCERQLKIGKRTAGRAIALLKNHLARFGSRLSAASGGDPHQALVAGRGVCGGWR